MTLIQKAAFIVSEAAKGLLQQHKYSNGYISVGDSENAEANIVIHAASTFLNARMHVWAESPFKTHESNQCKHLDLLVDLVPTDPEASTILTIEAKRIAIGEEDKKVEEILEDYERIRTWRSLDAHQMPLYMAPSIPLCGFMGVCWWSFLKPVENGALRLAPSSRCGGKSAPHDPRRMTT